MDVQVELTYILVFPSATLDYEALSLGRVSAYPEFP